MTTERTIRRALISTADKTGIVPLASRLAALGVELLATGGTAQLLQDAGLPVVEVAEYTGHPEILGGRVKTLHPRIHGGILARPGIDDTAIAEAGIPPIDLLVVNLYPFERTILAPHTFEDAIEQIDIGGPTMLRAGAKNFAACTVLVDPNDYAHFLTELDTKQGRTTYATRQQLAAKVFEHIAHYDRVIADYFSTRTPNETEATPVELFEPQLSLKGEKVCDLRYGENPHQPAALYQTSPVVPGSLVHAACLQGKPLSFNNLTDGECALSLARRYPPNTPVCVIVKHATPCGVAVGSTQTDAYHRAFACDSSSAFGGIIAFNTPIQGETAKAIIKTQFAEVILAPAVDDEAAAYFQTKPNLRVLACGALAPSAHTTHPRTTLHSLVGGFLIQAADSDTLSPPPITLATERAPTADELADLYFAWPIVQWTKSNAIVYAKQGMTLGIGGGQTSRVFAAKIAAMKAQEAKLSLTSAVMASDAFFPFADSIELAHKEGITAIIQPGGSMRDAEVIAAANHLGIAMLFTGERHFRH